MIINDLILSVILKCFDYITTFIKYNVISKNVYRQQPQNLWSKQEKQEKKFDGITDYDLVILIAACCMCMNGMEWPFFQNSNMGIIFLSKFKSITCIYALFGKGKVVFVFFWQMKVAWFQNRRMRPYVDENNVPFWQIIL